MTAAQEVVLGPKLVSENEEAQVLSELAKAALAVFDSFVQATRFKWWELGEAGAFIKKHELWRDAEPVQGRAAFHSWDDFVERKMQKGKSTVYRAVQLREELSVIEPEDAKRIPIVNALLLLRLKKRLGESKWCSPKTIEAAIKMSEEKFEEFCNELLPGAAKQEQEIKLIFKLEKSLHKRVVKTMKAILWANEIEGDDTRDALEALCEHFMQSQCEVEGYTAKGITNEEAYTHSRGRRKK